MSIGTTPLQDDFLTNIVNQMDTTSGVPDIDLSNIEMPEIPEDIDWVSNVNELLRALTHILIGQLG